MRGPIEQMLRLVLPEFSVTGRSRSFPFSDEAPGFVAFGIGVGAEQNVVKGNWLGILPDRKTLLAHSRGIVVSAANGSQIISNVVAGSSSSGLAINGSSASSRVIGNEIMLSGENGIQIVRNTPGLVISGNVIHDNGQRSPFFRAGIALSGEELSANRQVTISQNSIYNNVGLGISYKSDYEIGTKYDDTTPTKGDYPVLYYKPPPILMNGQLKIGGEFTGTPLATYLFEFFASDHANPSGYGEGQTFIGSAALTTTVTGSGVIDVTLPFRANQGNYLTATTTAPDGTTSEFSNAVLIQDCLPGVKGLCPGLEAQVPNLGNTPGLRSLRLDSRSVPSKPAKRGPRPAGGPTPDGPVSAGDGNGDGTPDWQQSNVASLPSISGVWVTLAAPPGTVLENVTPSGPPDFTRLPEGDTFPIGFLSFGITNLPANGALVVTNLLHLDAAPDFPYTATTFFNYGPTPENPQPHWYEFNFDGATGAELFADRILLHFRDGARGDDDLVANGQIITVGAPAYQVPPGPILQVLNTTVDWTTNAYYQPDTNGVLVLVTNAVPQVSCVLAWPASATNYMLEFTETLSPFEVVFDNTNVISLSIAWQPVPESPVVVNGQNIVTNAVISRSRFFRLMLMINPP